MTKSIFCVLVIFYLIVSDLKAQQPPSTSGVLSSTQALNFENCSQIISIHPTADDFAPNQDGKVLIRTALDSDYYTSYQSEDAKVRIVVQLDEASLGSTVYLRVVDPDRDDLSPYEDDEDGNDDLEGGDNRDPEVIAGLFSNGQSMISVEATSNGTGEVIAETLLNITERYSGDNYQVQASLNSDFSNSVSTIELIAWKRFYLEIDQMYKKGGTLRENFEETPSNTNDDNILLDNVSDFVGLPAGTQVVFFTQPFNSQGEIIAELIDVDISANTITIGDLPGSFSFPLGSGVRILGQEELIDSHLHLLEQAYGEITSGEDGGCFVEFKLLAQYASQIPKFTQFLDTQEGDDAMVNLLKSWRPDEFNPDFGANPDEFDYIQVVFANDNSRASRNGTTVSAQNLSILFAENFNVYPEVRRPDAIGETTVHELGHQFGLDPGVLPVVHATEIANNPFYDNHEGSDEGVMAIDRTRDNGIAEFHIQCIYFIRDILDLF